MSLVQTKPTRVEALTRYCLINLERKECQEVLSRLVASNRKLTTSIIDYCCSHGLRRFVIDEQEFTTKATPSKQSTTIETYPASLLLDYLPADQFIGACFHLQQLDADGKAIAYPMLYIAIHAMPMKDHRINDLFCIGCPYPKAKEVVKSSLIIKTAFSIQLNGYAVRHLALTSDKRIKAICYGVDREFLLCKQGK